MALHSSPASKRYHKVDGLEALSKDAAGEDSRADRFIFAGHAGDKAVGQLRAQVLKLGIMN